MRDVYVQAALVSVRKLRDILPQLSEEELHAALQLESDTQRRKNVMRELSQGLVNLNRQTYLTTLKEKYPCLVQIPL